MFATIFCRDDRVSRTGVIHPMRLAFILVGLGLFAAEAIGGVMTIRPSPVRSLGPAGLSSASLQLSVDPALVDALGGLAEVVIDDFRLPDGEQVTLQLTPVALDIGPTFIVDDSGSKAPRMLSPTAVQAWTGHVLGEPASRVFLGFSGDTAQGWVETSRGLDMLVTDPSDKKISFYRVGAARGGVDVPPPGTATVNTSAEKISGTPRQPKTDSDVLRDEYLRILRDISDADSPLHGRMDPDDIIGLVRLAGAPDIVVEVFNLGGCCLAPGFCYYIDETLCGEMCDSSTTTGVKCDNLIVADDPDLIDPNIDAPCWLGPGVQCNSQWACYESADAPGEDYDDNWVGACCYPDPDQVGVQVLGNLQACECAILGGRFLVPPYPCLGSEMPWEIPADRFLTAEQIAAVTCVDSDGDPLPPSECDLCYEPFGACCMDQGLLCQEVVDEEGAPNLSSVRCTQLPRGLCESGDEDVLTALNASVPGYFILECMPCVDQLDTTNYEGMDLPPPAWSSTSSPPICGNITTVVEYADPEDPMSGTVTDLLGPRSLVCEGRAVLLDSDPFFLQLFGGDYAAAEGYARVLAASVFATIERDTSIQFAISGIVLHDWLVEDPDPNGAGNLPDIDPNMLAIGACCFSTACYENISAYQCAQWTGEWQGQGSSCWTQPCGSGPILPDDILQHAPLDITQAIDELQNAWTVDLEDWANPAAGNSNSTALAELFCNSVAVVALGGAPYYVPVDSSEGPAQGVYRQGVATSGVGVMCNRSENFALVPVRGGFAPPPIANPAGESMWDFVHFARGMGLLAGVQATSLYGYDNCVLFPCDSIAALPDCTLRYDDPVATSLGVMPSTLMSNCLTCDGGIGNIQLRFRSEIAGRFYAGVAAMNCNPDSFDGWPSVCETALGSAEDYIDEEQYPDIFDDVFIVADDVPSQLDVLANDIGANCNSTSDGDLIDIVNTGAFGIDTCANGNATTTLGGLICVETLPSGVEVVNYTPPVNWCGIDTFVYEVVNANTSQPNPTGTVYLVPDTADVTLVPSAGSFSCNSNASVAISTHVPSDALTTPPDVADCGIDDTLICYSAVGFGGSVTRIRWDAAELKVYAGHESEAMLRFWFASVPGGVADISYDVQPFLPSGAGPAYPYCVSSTGSSQVPGHLGLFVPSSNSILVQCFETHDDGAVPDAEWKSFDLGIDVETNSNVVGVCCVEGLCIDTLTANQCADFHWRWDSGSSLWVEDINVSGFFYGAGTICGTDDWCTRRAPCCLGSVACVEVTPDVCENDLGGTVLTTPDDVFNPLEPLWGFPCSFTVCNLDPLTDVIGGCCVNSTTTGMAFCTDTTMTVCEQLPGLLLGGPWTSSWQVRAKCTATACSATAPSGSGFGACCFEALDCCTDGLSEAMCNDALGHFLGAGTTCGADCAVGPSIGGVCCFDSSSAGDWACIEGVTPTHCVSIGGTFDGTLSSCHGRLPCDPGTTTPVACCIDYDWLLVDSDVTCWEAGGLLAGVDGVDIQCRPIISSITVNGQVITVWAPTGTGTPLGFALDGDFDNDGRVGVFDLLILLDLWLGDTPNDPAGDLSGDGRTDVVDLLILFEHWG